MAQHPIDGGPVDVDPAQWTGRRQATSDIISPVQVRQMAAAFDDSLRLTNPFAGPLPAGWHWLYFNPIAPQAQLGEDGHPLRGDFLPPVSLPRRMWAGSRLQWQRAFVVGSDVRKTSEILSVARKQGRGGEMIFVTVEHQYTDTDGPLLREEHDIVYREAPGDAERVLLKETGQRIADGEHTFEREGEFVRPVLADEVLLYRYSAATFNGHRIHYDVDYCRDVEGYPGLVVHGPLIATLLLGWVENDLAAQLGGERFVDRFTFRAKSPTFHLGGFHLHARRQPDGAGLAIWSTNNLGQVGLDGTLSLR